MNIRKMNMGKMEKNEVKKICKADCKMRVQIPSSDVNRCLGAIWNQPGPPGYHQYYHKSSKLILKSTRTGYYSRIVKS